MKPCTIRGCPRPAYWVLDGERGYCTALHLHDDIGPGIPWTATREVDGQRQVLLREPFRVKAAGETPANL